jgi:hypothetical protein
VRCLIFPAPSLSNDASHNICLFILFIQGFADAGSVTIINVIAVESPTYVFGYEYDINEDNINGLTLKKFSEHAEGEMWNCGVNCPYKDYAKFVRYYQHFDYADAWIQKSFAGEATDFKFGNADFSRLEQPARAGKFM